jgi:hypothetical protein
MKLIQELFGGCSAHGGPSGRHRQMTRVITAVHRSGILSTGRSNWVVGSTPYCTSIIDYES